MGWRTIEDIDPTEAEARRLRRNRLARERRLLAAGWRRWPFGVTDKGLHHDTEHLDWICQQLGSICYEWLDDPESGSWIRRIED